MEKNSETEIKVEVRAHLSIYGYHAEIHMLTQVFFSVFIITESHIS